MIKYQCCCDNADKTTKNIFVFVNGRKHSGQKVVLQQNRWHHVLTDITAKVDPYFGKVEKLYTTSSGLTISSFTDLDNYGIYVASTRREPYKNIKGGYSIEAEPTQAFFEHYLSSQLTRINKYKKLAYVRRDLLVIYIFRNGECGHSFKIVLTSDDLSNWNCALSFVALIIDMPQRCIKSLYSVNGNRICGPWELQHGASYVAVGYDEIFKKGCYHVEEKSAEIFTTGYPVVPKDKNLKCEHKKGRNDLIKPICGNKCSNKKCKSKTTPTATVCNRCQNNETANKKKIKVHLRIIGSTASTISCRTTNNSSISKTTGISITPKSAKTDQRKQMDSAKICSKCIPEWQSSSKATKTNTLSGNSTNNQHENRNLTWKNLSKKHESNYNVSCSKTRPKCGKNQQTQSDIPCKRNKPESIDSSTSCCSSNNKRKSKTKHKNKTYMLNRDGSDSNLKKTNRVGKSCLKSITKNSSSCSKSQPRKDEKSILSRLSTFLFNSKSAESICRRKKCPAIYNTDSDSEQSCMKYRKKQIKKSSSHTNMKKDSSCSICRIQKYCRKKNKYNIK